MSFQFKSTSPTSSTHKSCTTPYLPYNFISYAKLSAQHKLFIHTIKQLAPNGNIVDCVFSKYSRNMKGYEL